MTSSLRLQKKYSSVQVCAYLNSPWTLHITAVGTAWSLIGSPLKGQAAIHPFQNHILSWKYIHMFSHCVCFWNGWKTPGDACAVRLILPACLSPRHLKLASNLVTTPTPNYPIHISLLLLHFPLLHTSLYFALVTKTFFRHLRFVMSDRLSVRLSACNNSAAAGRIFVKFDFFSRKSAEKIQVPLQTDKNDRYFTWLPMYIYDHNSPSFS